MHMSGFPLSSWIGEVAPYDWTIDDPQRRVFVRGHGQGVTADTLGLIAELASELRGRAGYDFVYNSVELRIDSSPADMMKVANALFRDAALRFRRFAIVVPSNRLALARIFVALAHPFGISANVFADEETALEWLAEPGDAKARRATDTTPLPEATDISAESRRPEGPQGRDPRHEAPTYPEFPGA
jgi:hypothetical protein